MRRLRNEHLAIHRVGLFETYCFISTSVYRYTYMIQGQVMYGDHLYKYAPNDEKT